MRHGWALLPLLTSLLACDRGGGRDAQTSSVASPSALPASSLAQHPSPAPEAWRWPSQAKTDGTFTAGIVDYRPAPVEVALLTEVRAAKHDGFDRVVFELGRGSPPGYHLEYVDRPVRQCGSGEPTPIAGDAWLEVRLEPASAHTTSGDPTIAHREQMVGLPVVLELEQTCDFEAQVVWVLGVKKPNKYRVSTLDEPLRLVVDVKH